MLARAGVSPRVAMELMRHSDMRLTAKTYTDAMNLPLFDELVKITPLPPPSLIASLKCEIPGLKAAKPVQKGSPKKDAKIIPSDYARETLTELVPSWENSKMAEGVGFGRLLEVFSISITPRPPPHYQRRTAS